MRNKETEISTLKQQLKQHEQNLPRIDSPPPVRNSQASLRTTFMPSKSLFQPEELRKYYESEINSLSKQTKHFEKLAGVILPSEEKLQLLSEELHTLIQYNVKKCQMIASRITTLTRDDIGKRLGTSCSEATNENIDPQMASGGLRDSSAGSTRLVTSHSNHKLRHELAASRYSHIISPYFYLAARSNLPGDSKFHRNKSQNHISMQKMPVEEQREPIKEVTYILS